MFSLSVLGQNKMQMRTRKFVKCSQKPERKKNDMMKLECPCSNPQANQTVKTVGVCGVGVFNLIQVHFDIHKA